MQVNLTVHEAQHLLDGINVVIGELVKERDFWRGAPVPQETRDRLAGEVQVKLSQARAARDKIQRVR